MKKMLIALLGLLLSLTLCAQAELNYEIQSSGFQVLFPELGGWRGMFRKADTWTFVTAENLEEHLGLVLARGDREEDVRRRFAEDTLIFEAYSPLLEEDTCYRVERFENAFTRRVWDLMQWEHEDIEAFKDEMLSRHLLERYDVFHLKLMRSSTATYYEGKFTTYVPDAHEGGNIYISFHDGALYAMTYNIAGRLSADARYLTDTEKENDPRAGSFRVRSQSRPADLDLDDLWPVHVNVAGSDDLPANSPDSDPDRKDTCHSVTYTGTLEWGSKLSVTLDGEDIPVQMKNKYDFSVTLPMKTAGDHQAVFTVTHNKYQDHVRTVTLRATEDYAPLIFTSLPDTWIKTGDHTVAGKTAPCTTLTLRLDGADPIEVPVDAEGNFTHTLTIEDDELHTLRVEAAVPGRMTTCYEMEFVAEFADAMAAIRHFEAGGISETPVQKMIDDPASYVGQRVKTSVWTREVDLVNGEGLSVRCLWNYQGLTSNYWWEREDVEGRELKYIYLKVPSYAQDGLYKNMMLDVYGTVCGTHPYTDPQGVTSEVLEIEVDFVTYYE